MRDRGRANLGRCMRCNYHQFVRFRVASLIPLDGTPLGSYAQVNLLCDLPQAYLTRIKWKTQQSDTEPMSVD